MQSLAKESIESVSPSDCSAQLLEVAPLVMRRIRSEMRHRTMPGLSIPQFRTLNYLWKRPGASLSDLAAFLGLALPSTSKLVQKLVVQKVVMRRAARDRRRIRLSVTEQGIAALALAQQETREQLADSLESLTPEELSTVSAALVVLGRAFSQGGVDVNVP